jgi:hypothetical protein
MKTNDETVATQSPTDDNNAPLPLKTLLTKVSTTANTAVCSMPLFVAHVCSFVVCFVCRGEGKNLKTMVGIV